MRTSSLTAVSALGLWGRSKTIPLDRAGRTWLCNLAGLLDRIGSGIQNWIATIRAGGGFSIRMVVGYARVSTVDQNPDYQVRALKERGCGRIFTDRCWGRSLSRPQLDAALARLREGDTLAVWKLDRLARSVPHLLRLAAELERRRCELVSLTEAIDTGSPGGRLAFTIFGAMAQFESDLNRERTREAHQAARASGKRWGRPSIFHNPANVRVAKALLRDRGVSRDEAARRLGITKMTLRRWFPGYDPDSFRGRNGGEP